MAHDRTATCRLVLTHARTLNIGDGHGEVLSFVAAEDALRDSEELLRGAFDHAPIGMALTTLDGHWIRVNRALCEMSGYSEEEFLATTFQEITHPADRQLTDELLRQLLAGERRTYQIEKRYLHRFGHSVWVSLTVALARDGQGRPRYFLVQISNVSQRLNAEAALRESETLLRDTQELANVGSWAWDVRTGATTWSEQLYRLFGLEPGLVIATYERLLSVMHPDDRGRVEEVMAKAARHGGNFAFDHRIIRPDSVIRTVHCIGRVSTDSNGLPTRIVCSAQDITERRRAEELGHRQRETLQTIFDHIPAMITVADAAGQLIFVNHEWSRVTGWSFEDSRDIDVLAELYPHPDERARVQEYVRSATGRAQDFRMRVRDGRFIDTVWAIVTLSDGSAVSIGQDVTARHQLEEQLRQAQKMEAVGQLAAGVAHDFNNILAAISGYAELLEGDLAVDDARRADVAEIRKAARRGSGLTRQLLSFSRKQVLQPEVIDINQIVGDAATMLRSLLGTARHVVILPAPVAASVFADRTQMEQILMNLALNARDAMPAEGTLTIEVGVQPRTATSPPMVLLGVNDTGIGMSPEVQARAFEPFFTTKPVGQGTGLGLATVHGIVQQSEGTIRIASRRGVGTTVSIALPAARAVEAVPAAGSENGPPTVAAVRPPAVRTAARPTATILVVEDEGAIRAMARRVLERAGYRVLSARHGADALRSLTVHGDVIDVLLSDIVMPEMGGVELAGHAVQRAPGLRVILMSGYTDADVGVIGAGGGGIVDAFLQKPFTADSLLQVVHAAVRVRELTR